jgi:hypothetical protein
MRKMRHEGNENRPEKVCSMPEIVAIRGGDSAAMGCDDRVVEIGITSARP